MAPPRTEPPGKIWDLAVYWTVEERINYKSSTESQQDKLDVEKYLKTRGPVLTTTYDHLVEMQRQQGSKTNNNKFTIKNFRLLLQVMKDISKSPTIQSRTHLVTRNQTMMKIFLEDFQNLVFHAIQYLSYNSKTNQWELNSLLPNVNTNDVNITPSNSYNTFPQPQFSPIQTPPNNNSTFTWPQIHPSQTPPNSYNTSSQPQFNHNQTPPNSYNTSQQSLDLNDTNESNYLEWDLAELSFWKFPHFDENDSDFYFDDENLL